MRNINLFGTVFGISGYDNHCRQLLNALYNKNKNIHLECNKPDRWEIGCPDYIFKSISNTIYEDGVTIAVALPHQWPMIWDTSKDFIGFLVWEGDKVPKFWIDYILNPKVKQVWVPSKHTKQAIKNTLEGYSCSEEQKKKVHNKAFNELIKVVPHGVDTELFKPGKKKKGPYTFIMNKGWRAGINDRGGVQWALKAFSEEFKKEEDVEMVVKINPAYCGPEWNLEQELKKLEIKPNKKLKFIVDGLPFDQIPKLYHMGDCFVSTSMAEAFNLPVAEAMSCNLPVIITDFGGQTDFVPKDGYNTYINTTLIPANDGVMYEEVKWAKPDIESLKCAMREMVGNTKSKNREHMVKGWTWKHTADKALANIDTI